MDATGWANYPPYQTGQAPLRYPVPFAGAHQQINSAMAIATLYALRDQGWQITDEAIQTGMAQAQWPGRLQWTTWQAPDGQQYPWLIDGAHNPAAAIALRQYRDDLQRPTLAAEEVARLQRVGLSSPLPPTTTWLMGMLSTKDHADVFAALLRPGDRLHLVPVPGHATMSPADLQAIALQVCPNLAACTTYETLAAGLAGAIADPGIVKVLCGSLYLIGHFFQTQQA